MVFCSNCGKKSTDDNNLFCKECGQRLPTLTEKSLQTKATETDSIHQEIPEQNSQAEPPRKKKKWPLILIALLAIAALAGHFIIKSTLDPQKEIKAMDEDFQKENKKAFLKHFNYDKKTNADAEGFYDYIDEQNWLLTRKHYKI